MTLTEKVCYGVNCRGHVNKPIAMFAESTRYPDGYARKCSECLEAEALAVDADRGARGPTTGPQWSVPTGKPAPIPVVQKKEKPEAQVAPTTKEPKVRARPVTATMPENFVALVDGYRSQGCSWRNIGELFANRHGCAAGWTNISQLYYKEKHRTGESKPSAAAARTAVLAAHVAKTASGVPQVSEVPPVPAPTAAAGEVGVAPPSVSVSPPAVEYTLAAEDACTLREAIKLFDERARQLEVEANNYRDMARRTREMLHE